MIAGTEPEAEEYVDLSYEGVLKVMTDRLLSDEQLPLTVRRICCSSVHMKTMPTETCEEIRELAGVTGRSENREDKDTAIIRKKLDIAINNWYLRGRISISDEDIIGPFECGKG